MPTIIDGYHQRILRMIHRAVSLSMAIVDALSGFAPHITSPDMTLELESDMMRRVRRDTRDGVVRAPRTTQALIDAAY